MLVKPQRLHYFPCRARPLPSQGAITFSEKKPLSSLTIRRLQHTEAWLTFHLNQIFSQLERFSIESFLNRIFSQSDLFSIGSFLNQIFSQSDLFSIESFWGSHHQLDDSLVQQLTNFCQRSSIILLPRFPLSSFSVYYLQTGGGYFATQLLLKFKIWTQNMPLTSYSCGRPWKIGQSLIF